jgi:ElaB/YqjD/DUF883 family membrane-anchored ribosome-binding protein
MKTQTIPESRAEAELEEDAQSLLAATARSTEKKVVEARERLSSALEKGRAAWANVQEKAVQGAKVTDEAIREHPYPALGIAFGVGLVLGVLLRRRN